MGSSSRLGLEARRGGQVTAREMRIRDVGSSEELKLTSTPPPPPPLPATTAPQRLLLNVFFKPPCRWLQLSEDFRKFIPPTTGLNLLSHRGTPHLRECPPSLSETTLTLNESLQNVSPAATTASASDCSRHAQLITLNGPLDSKLKFVAQKPKLDHVSEVTAIFESTPPNPPAEII